MPHVLQRKASALALFALFALFLLFLAACAGVQTQDMQLHNGEQILNKVCNHCHSHERICDNLGKDTAFWNSRVKRMNMYGANLDEGQTAMMVAFLADQQPGTAPVCHD